MTAPTLRTRIAQMDVAPGRPVENTGRMLSRMAEAVQDKVDILVFPEMAVPGYLLADEWERASFLRECERCHRELRDASRGLVTIFGSVGVDPHKRNEDGRVRKYNALYVIDDGSFVGPDGGPYPFLIKTLLPNYREFDDSRHFFDLRKLALELGCELTELLQPVTTSRGRLSCVLCEDAWDLDYGVSPLDLLSLARADLYVNISASPFTLNKNHKRNRVFAEHARRLKRPLIYANQVGLQDNAKTVFTFDGSSCIYDAYGKRTASPPSFEEACLTHDIPIGEPCRFGSLDELAEDGVERIYQALTYGTRAFMNRLGIRRVTVGVSGGIDSAVAAALYRRILAPQDLLLVTMPSTFNSPKTRGLALELARNLGCFYAEVPIQDGVELTRQQIDRLDIRNIPGTRREQLRLSALDIENIQARDRSSRLLAAVSSAFGGVFTCNANKSEAAVGYTTLYGDLSGYFANLADLWKTEIYELARFINTDVYGGETIPSGTLDIVPSAELSSGQNVERGQGDPLVYPYHDCLFRSWVEWWNRATPEEILDWYARGILEAKIGYDGNVHDLFPSAGAFVEDLERWWNLYQGLGIAKRIQAPPILAVKRRAFGFDHREAQMGARYTRAYQERKQALLDREQA